MTPNASEQIGGQRRDIGALGGERRFDLKGFDLEVVDQVPIQPQPNEHNAHYLATKRDKMGHEFGSLTDPDATTATGDV